MASFAARTDEAEELDDLNAAGEDLRRSLLELAFLNRWLGGHSSFLSGVKLALSSNSLPGRPHLVDVGCGSGDGLRDLAEWARVTRTPLKLTGIDGNQDTLQFARELSADYPEIEYIHRDALNADWAELKPDIITANLFCHHLSDIQLRRWLAAAAASDASAVVINDLQRHWLPHALFLALCAVCQLSRVTRHDGAVSVRRAFVRTELEELALLLHPFRYQLRFRFAFRYQLVALR